jgi:hypothetical protein
MRRSAWFILLIGVVAIAIVLVAVELNRRAALTEQAVIRSRLIVYCTQYQVRNHLPDDGEICRRQLWRADHETEIAACQRRAPDDSEAFYHCLEDAGVIPL